MKSWNSGVEAKQATILANYDSITVRRPLIERNYIGKLLRWEHGKSKTTGNDYTRFHFTILDEGFAGHTVSYFVSWTPESEVYSKEYCESLGIDPRNKVEDYPPIYVEISVVKPLNSRFFNVSRTRRIDEEEMAQRLATPAGAEPAIPVPGML